MPMAQIKSRIGPLRWAKGCSTKARIFDRLELGFLVLGHLVVRVCGFALALENFTVQRAS